MKQNQIACYHKYEGAGRHMNLHTHDSYEIFVFYEGQAHFQVGEQFYLLQPGDIVLNNGRVPHRVYVSNQSEVYLRSTLHFSLDWMLPTIRRNDLTGFLSNFNDNDVRHIQIYQPNFQRDLDFYFNKIERLIQEATPTMPNDNQVQSLIGSLLTDLSKLEINSKNPSYQIQYSNKHVGAVVNVIMTSYQEELTLDRIAEEVTLSKNYLSTLFKEQTGMSVKDFLMQYRIYQASTQLLFSSDESITEVAINNGFKSVAHFSRCFKRMRGMTPSEFRRKEQVKFINKK